MQFGCPEFPPRRQSSSRPDKVERTIVFLREDSSGPRRTWSVHLEASLIWPSCVVCAIFVERQRRTTVYTQYSSSNIITCYKYYSESPPIFFRLFSHTHVHQPGVWRMNRLTRDGTTEPVSRDQILRRERGQGEKHFPCSADHEQDWQPYRLIPNLLYNAIIYRLLLYQLLVWGKRDAQLTHTHTLSRLIRGFRNKYH